MTSLLNPKKKNIIEAATRIFADKGYFSTSVQEIAEQCSISKASLYKLFSSKEELFIEVFEYHQNLMFQKASIYSFDTSLSSRDLLIKQFCTQIEDFLKRKDFIFMQLKDTPSSGNNNLKKVMKKMRSRILLWQKECLIQAYGEEIEPYIWDLTITLQGLMKEYITILTDENDHPDIKAISIFLVDRLDSLVHGFLARKTQPLLNEDLLFRYLMITEPTTQTKTAEIINQLKVIDKYIQSRCPDERKENLLGSLSMLREELKMSQPRLFLIDALSSYFEKETELIPIVQKLRSTIL